MRQPGDVTMRWGVTFWHMGCALAWSAIASWTHRLLLTALARMMRHIELEVAAREGPRDDA